MGATQIAHEVIRLLESFCIKIDIAGSLRRNRSTINDIDLLVIPKPELFPKLSRLNNAGVIKIKGHKFGTKTNRFSLESFEYKGRSVDLYAGTESDYYIQLLVWTGPVAHNLMLVEKAKNMGLKIGTNDDGIRGVYKSSERLDNNSEQSVYEILGLQYYPPNTRDFE